MVVWSFVADRRLRKAETDSQPKDKTCLFCAGALLRLAEREPFKPYHWKPCGFICSVCNAVFVEVGK